MRALLVLLLSCVITAARAGAPGPCPSFTAGWALSGSGPITGILWDQSTKQMYFIWTNTPVLETLYCPLETQNAVMLVTEGTPLGLRSENPACTVTLRKNVVSDYYPVPDSSVMQTFSQTPQANWVQTFNYLIAPRYEAILLQDVNNCPVLQETSSFVCNLEDENGTQPIATEANAVLFTENPVCSSVPGGFVWVD
jgi:hypothetical protein